MALSTRAIAVRKKGFKVYQRLRNPNTTLYLLYADGLSENYTNFGQVDIFFLNELEFPKFATVQFAETLDTEYTTDVTRNLSDIFDRITHFAVDYNSVMHVYSIDDRFNRLEDKFYLELQGRYTRDTFIP